MTTCVNNNLPLDPFHLAHQQLLYLLEVLVYLYQWHLHHAGLLVLWAPAWLRIIHEIIIVTSAITCTYSTSPNWKASHTNGMMKFNPQCDSDKKTISCTISSRATNGTMALVSSFAQHSGIDFPLMASLAQTHKRKNPQCTTWNNSRRFWDLSDWYY